MVKSASTASDHPVYTDLQLQTAPRQLFCQKIARTALLASLLLAPLKLGNMLLPGVPQSFSGGWVEVFLLGFPPSFFVILSALLLVLAIAAYGIPGNLSCRQPLGKLLVCWLALPLAALIGFIDADALESPVVELEYILGLSSFALATAIVLAGGGSQVKTQMLNMLTAGTLITALAGVYQYIWGFDELKNFIETQEKVYQIKIPIELKARAYDVRTYATFTFASALAGMFCLSGAVTVIQMAQWGKKFEPAALSQKLFGVLAFLLCAGVFLTTKGRSAFLAVIAAMALSGILLIKDRKLKILTFAAALAVIAAGALYIGVAGRGFGSMTERVGYLKSSLEMLVQHPLTGDGWGDFSFHHAMNKNFGNSELAKDPHNFAAAFAAQTGIAGLLLSAGLILLSIYFALRQMLMLKTWESRAVFFSLCAFSLHMLMDLDWQVPALMMWWCAIMFIAVTPSGTDHKTDAGKSWRKLKISTAILLALLTLTGGIHWSAVDHRFSKMLQAAGQEIGSERNFAASYEIDQLATNALRLAPYSPSIYIAWGNDAWRRMDYLQAEKRLQKALELVPRSHSVHERLGEIYEKLQNSEKSRFHFQRANELFPYKKIFENMISSQE